MDFNKWGVSFYGFLDVWTYSAAEFRAISHVR